jgi:Tol biopolymer transport system component
VVYVDGAEPTRVTDSGKTNSDNVVPSWSHDGNAIYFSSNRTGSWQIWRHTLDTGVDVQVTSHGGFNGMETGDGRFLIYVADLERTEIRKLALQGQENDLPLVSLGPGLWHAWTISRDDLFFLRTSSATSITTLFHFDLKSHRLQSLGQVDQAVNDSLSASSDGRWILFARRSNANTSIMILDGWD